MRRLVLVFLAAATLSACSNVDTPSSPSNLDSAVVGAASESGMASPTTASTAAPSPSAANFEQKFMKGMINHHQMAVEMAEICLSKTVHEDLRQMCEEIIAAQTREIRRMLNWLQDWYSVSYSPQMSRGDDKELAHLRSLSGEEFEIMFMEMMIQHHEAAIREAQTCLDRAYHRQMIRLCDNIISTQSAEIEQMQQWLCEWYGRCEAAS